MNRNYTNRRYLDALEKKKTVNEDNSGCPHGKRRG